MCGNEVRAIANNPLGAKPGQKVVIESQSSKVFGAVALVYIMPIVLFLAGYLAAAAIGASEVCALRSALARCFSAPSFLWCPRKERKKK